MPSVTFLLDATILSDVDRIANEREVSRSRQISDIIRAYFAPKQPSSFEVRLLEQRIDHLTELMVIKDEQNEGLKQQNSHLWQEFNEAQSHLAQYQIPASSLKRGFWSRLFGGKKE